MTPHVANQFEILPKNLCDLFRASTLVGEFILAKRVYLDCHVSINYKDTMDDLVEFDMVDYDVILFIQLIHDFYTSINCRNRVVKFQIPNDPVIKWASSSAVPKGRFI